MDLAEILNERLSLSWHEYSAVVGRWPPDMIPSLFPRRPHARVPDLPSPTARRLLAAPRQHSRAPEVSANLGAPPVLRNRREFMEEQIR